MSPHFYGIPHAGVGVRALRGQTMQHLFLVAGDEAVALVLQFGDHLIAVAAELDCVHRWRDAVGERPSRGADEFEQDLICLFRDLSQLLAIVFQLFDVGE